MTATTLISVAMAALFTVLAWLAVHATQLMTRLAARPAVRRVGRTRGARWTMRLYSGGRDWITGRVTAQVLVLAAGAALVIALGSIFAELTEAVLGHDNDRDDLTVWDRPILRWLAAHRSPALTQAEIGITDLGGALALTLLLTAAAVTVALRQRSWRPVIVTVVAAGGIQLLVYLIKVTVGRERPLLTGRLVNASGYSFPSGHSASAIACFGVLAWLVSMTTRRASIRATAWLTAGLLTVAVGLSRAYLGVHYPTDILGGWILGGTWLATVATAAYLTGYRRQ